MGGNLYYAFTPNPDVLFFVLETTYPTPELFAWLEKELKALSHKWKIVVLHQPLYSSGDRHGSDLRIGEVLEPLLVNFNVSVLSGHDHFYERVKPRHGVAYFVVSSGGQLRVGDIDRGSGITAKGSTPIGCSWRPKSPAMRCTSTPFHAWARSSTPASSRAALRDINLHFHDLRHEAGSRFVDGGMPVHHVKELLGHANIKTTDTYLNVTTTGLHDSMRRFDESALRCNPVATKAAIDPALDCNADSPTVANVLVN
jgi:hypothetical protein